MAEATIWRQVFDKIEQSCNRSAPLLMLLPSWKALKNPNGAVSGITGV